MNTHAEKISENKNQSLTNSVTQKKHNSGQPSFQFADNRTESMVQRKLYEISNNSNQIKQTAQLKFIANSPSVKTIQRMGVEEEELLQGKFGTLQKVEHSEKLEEPKKLDDSEKLGKPNKLEETNELDDFVKAYEKSRYYHHTKDKNNLTSIEDNGLLNYNDRLQKLNEDVQGMSNNGGAFKGDEKKGVFLGKKDLYEKNPNMQENLARAFMQAERTITKPPSEEENTPPEQMYRDQFFPGGVITKNSIPSEQVTTKSISEIIKENGEKLKGILKAVGSQYPSIIKKSAPDEETMKGLLQNAIHTRRLSNVAFDNNEKRNKK